MKYIYLYYISIIYIYIYYFVFHTYTNIIIYLHVRIYIYTCIYIFIYLCIYIFTYILLAGDFFNYYDISFCSGSLDSIMCIKHQYKWDLSRRGAYFGWGYITSRSICRMGAEIMLEIEPNDGNTMPK